MPLVRPLVLGFLILVPPLLGRPAEAQDSPRSVSDCERLKNDLAYNQCLSLFGPAAKNVAGGEGTASTGTTLSALPPAVAAAIPVAEEPASAVRRGRHSRRGGYGRRGRQVASFSVGGGETRSYRRHRRRH